MKTTQAKNSIGHFAKLTVLTLAFLTLLFLPQRTFAAQEIELFYTDQFDLAWWDQGSGADRDGSFWVPRRPAGQNIFAFGHAARGGYGQASSMPLGKALVASAFAHPTGFARIWTDAGSGADLDGAMWNPIPPAGYVSLGTVTTRGATPSTLSVVCVRDDLVVQGTVGDLIWNDAGSGADRDFSAWKIDAPAGAIAFGTFIGTASHAKPSGPVYCLKLSATAASPAPSQSVLESLISTFGPIIKFHPSEAYLPDDPAAMLNHPDTQLQWMTVENEDANPGFGKTLLGSRTTSAGTILDDVQSALAHPQATNGTFRYLLNYSFALAGGNLNRANAYVRAQPSPDLPSEIELQFWIFYPWNGNGKSRLTVGSIYDKFFDPTGTMGRHYSDWENIRVRVSNKNVWSPGVYSLVNVVLSRHSFEEVVGASDPRLQKSAGHPVIYSAKDSHAHYLSAGRHFYARPKSVNLGVGTFAVDLYDLTGDGQVLNTYSPGKHILVSASWPSIQTTAPDWLFFGGIWGDYLLNQFSVTVTDTIFGDLYTHTEREVGNGKPGLLRRGQWAVAHPENANLGSLRTSAGALTPAFNPLVSVYSAMVGSGVSQITVTPQAADYNATVKVQFNGNTLTMDKGSLLGKQSIPLTLAHGPNPISIIVDSLQGGNVTASKTYTLTVTRQPISTVVVNSNDAGDGSLRQVVADAPTGSTITFAPGLSGQTILLGGTQIVINKNLTIDASSLSNPIRVSGNGASRVFQIAAGSSSAMKALLIAAGNAPTGGGIENLGTLLLDRVILRGNTTSGRGGGIRNEGTLAIINSTLAGNTAGDVGGGIVNNGTLSLTNSTLSENTSLGSNGQQGFGGAIFNFSVPLTLVHCTVAGNSATTVGGGLRLQGGNVAIQNSIIAGNTATTGSDLAHSGTTFDLGGANFIGDNSTVTSQFPTGPLAGTAANPLDPRLAPLNYFQPYYISATTVRPLLPGSPAIDMGVIMAGTPLTDQRGAPRPLGQRPDLGALEAFPLSLIPLHDLDSDGIDDRIEPSYPQLANGRDDRVVDSDGDGSPDGQELFNMTDPNNPNDALRIVSFAAGVPGLVAQWVAEDWAGGTSEWVDRVGGKIATVAGVARSPIKTAGAFPRRGPTASSGLVFDGVDDYLSVSVGQNPIVGKTSVTIGALFRTTRGASEADGFYWRYPGPLNAESPGNPNDWGLTYDAAGNAQGLFNQNISPSPAVSLIDGQPHTMILTWRDPSVFPGEGVARFYVDGVLVGSRAMPDGGNGIVTNGFVIGSEPEQLLRYFSGAIGELRFYDSIQDAAALHSDMTGASKLFTVTFPVFPGLAYELETGSALPYFTAAPGTQVVATTTNAMLPILLDPGVQYVRVHRGHTRWASRVVAFSSQFGPVAWSVAQVLGRPDTYPAYGDIATAWASATPAGQPEFLELGFDAPAPIDSVSIYETYVPGAVSKVSVRNSGTEMWVQVWNGIPAPAGDASRIFTVRFPMTDFSVDAVRIDLDSPAVPGWNEIDAVSINTTLP